MADLNDAKRIIPLAFPNITGRDVEKLITNSEIHTYPSQYVLCHENASEYIFYILLDGEVEVTKIINMAENRVLKHLGPGSFFGEMALIHNAPRAATVTTVSPTTVLEIYKSNFDAVLESSTTFALAMAREISRRLRENDQLAIEDLRMRANELARAYQQLAEIEFARSQFLSTIAHELRTPLTVANGFLQVLQTGKVTGDGLKIYLDTVARNIQEITSLINDILFLQEMELIITRDDTVDVVEIIRNITSRLTPKALENHVNVHLHAPQGVPLIRGDFHSLERAFNALLDNAIKFSPEGGDVDITVQGDDSQMTVSFKDHGVGIPPDVLPSIFDRFFHLEEVGGHLFRGIGLGLSIARQVLEQHNGKIDVESELGSGSTFIVTLPREEPAASQPVTNP